MRRNPTQQRAPSPTNTTYSGISNYRTDSYRPIRDKNAVPPLDPRLIARTHFEELSRYLASYLAKEPPNSRTTARQKLTRLTRQQFQELSTDVYDELVRRKNNSDKNEIPFLPVRDDFHPKRNQARQKLATLPTARFKDLSSDVYYELVRRYPEFKEESSDVPLTSPGSSYDDYPSPDFPTSPRGNPTPPLRNARSPDTLPNGSRRRPSEDDYGSSGRRSEDPYGGVGGEDAYGGTRRSQDTARRPSQDTTRRPSQDTARSQDYGGGLGAIGRRSIASASDSTSTTNAQSATATSGMIIPNKSTIAEEDIEVPYGRATRESGSTTGEGEGDGDELEGGLGGLSGLSRRLGRDEDDGAARSGDDYFDKMSFGRASVNSDRSLKGGRASVGVGEEQEKIRREYEFRIATMQSRIAGLEREVEDAAEKERQWSGGEERVRHLEDELAEVRQNAEEQSAKILAMQKELEEMREDRERAQEREARRAREDEEELQILRERCERLEEERASGGFGGADADIVDQLRSDMEGLLAEVSDLSRRNDELMTSKDSDLVVIRDLDTQLKEYKRKYEQAKTELRSSRATSQLYLQTPKFDEQLPVSAEGGVADVHVTAFLSAIDNLLTAGRSNAPTRVLTPMKAVVNAVTAIVEDIRSYERRPRRDRGDVDPEALQALRERAEATLGNLVVASKTHATSSGLSPVSLLDAAASHVSAAITEIGRTILVRKATRAEQEQFAATQPSTPSANGFAPALRTVEETRPSMHQRGPSESSTFSRRGEDYAPPVPSRSTNQANSPPGRSFLGRSPDDRDRYRQASDASSSQASSPPPIFDRVQTNNTGGITSDDSAVAEGTEDAWAELKPYLEAQNDSILYAIQLVLSGVRSPTPSPTLNENVTQIITIVSSIVAVCHDNLPPASAKQGNELLRELGDHANILSEEQALPEVTKESRQVMARSSFAIANAMKALVKL
ncbi:hypothetical protein DENSPDRAFT_836571 [Dentipellis sp. KUC8613]|nr:hypothetical protein DENSPDRAFT_836571 [Dentipellis sp. KUC8613]